MAISYTLCQSLTHIQLPVMSDLQNGPVVNCISS